MSFKYSYAKAVKRWQSQCEAPKVTESRKGFYAKKRRRPDSINPAPKTKIKFLYKFALMNL